jgi:hypothetical protein
MPLAHVFPQPPQLPGSFCVSTQAAPHAVVPCATHSQCPDVHCSPLPQTTPHAPQLFGSFTETGTPLHVWHWSTTPLQSLSTPSRHDWLGSRLQAQMGWDRSSGCKHFQLIAAGQSMSVVQERVQTPPDGSVRTQSSDAQSSVSEHDCPNAPGPGGGEKEVEDEESLLVLHVDVAKASSTSRTTRASGSIRIEVFLATGERSLVASCRWGQGSTSTVWASRCTWSPSYTPAGRRSCSIR